MSSFIITREQIENLRPYLPNIDELIKLDENEFYYVLDDRVLDFFGKVEPTPTALYLERIRDTIFWQNDPRNQTLFYLDDDGEWKQK